MQNVMIFFIIIIKLDGTNISKDLYFLINSPDFKNVY